MDPSTSTINPGEPPLKEDIRQSPPVFGWCYGQRGKGQSCTSNHLASDNDMEQTVHFNSSSVQVCQVYNTWYETAHDKTKQTNCVPNEQSNQSGHPPSLISL